MGESFLKKIIITAVLFISLCTTIYLVLYNKQFSILNSQFLIFSPSPSPLPSVSPTVKPEMVEFNGLSYACAYFEVLDMSKLSLIANFSDKKTSKDNIDENTCTAAVNGGFYDTNNKPLGLFINQSLQTTAIQSSLLNGFLSIDSSPDIAYAEPKHVKMAIQTGPMLLLNGKKLPLIINNDEHARRVIAGITDGGFLVFLTIYTADSVSQGPLLGDIPEIVEIINTKLPHPLVSAINLDGGNASVFKNKDIYIPEVSTVGSMFCLQE